MKNCPPFLESFLTAYIECALWSSVDDRENPMDKLYSAENIAPETLAQMQSDCLKFYSENELEPLAQREQIQAGHDFWLTRNCHGCGFWDGDWPEPQATLLTTAAHEFGMSDLYVDNGKIYCSPMK